MTQSGALPQPGDVIAGKYRVERTLGVGGMGAVFEATHQVTQRRFAIKWLLPELAASEEHSKRFVREAMVAGRLDHPHVVQVYDIGQEGTASFMVMELLHGESLAGRLTRAGRLHYAEACELLVPCLWAVSAAHRASIIHRDLKPANIFVCEPGPRGRELAKVLDFGISKFLPGAGVDAMRTDTGIVMGTPHYMAPEQMRSLPLDQRVDVYALGVMFYEVLSGRRPFDATSYPELVIKVVSEAVTPLEQLVPELPPGVSAAISRAMERDPNARFQSVDELAQVLEDYQDDSASSPHSSTRALERAHGSRPPLPKTPMSSEFVAAQKPAGRGGWRAAFLGAATLAAAGLVTMFVLLWNNEHGEHPGDAPRTAVGASPAKLTPLDADMPHPRIERSAEDETPHPHTERIAEDETPVKVVPEIVPVQPAPVPPTAASPERPRLAPTAPQLAKPRKPEPAREPPPQPPAAAPQPAPSNPGTQPRLKLGSEDFDDQGPEIVPVSRPKPQMDPSGF